MASGEGGPGSPGADQSLQDMAASWQPLIDSVNLRRQPAPATPEKRGNLLGRIFGGHHAEILPAAEPAPAAPEPALTPETRKNPFIGVFQGAILSLRDKFPGLPTGEAATGYLAEQFRQKASLVPTLGHSLEELIHTEGNLNKIKKIWNAVPGKAEMAVGAAVGMITKEAAKWAFNMILAEPGTLLARAGVGAVGGAAVAGVKEWRKQDKEYRQFSAELSRKLGTDFSMADFTRRYDELIKQSAAERDVKKRELLYDQLRYLSVNLKKTRWVTKNEKGVRLSKTQVLDTFLTDFGARAEYYNKEAIRRHIEEASSIQLGRVGKRAMRGAAFGAAGAIAGGLLVDFIHDRLATAGSAVSGVNATKPTSSSAPVDPTADRAFSPARAFSPERAAPIVQDILEQPEHKIHLTEMVRDNLIDSNRAVDQAIQTADFDRSKISSVVYEQARRRVQEQMESVANTVYQDQLTRLIEQNGNYNFDELKALADQEFVKHLHDAELREHFRYDAAASLTNSLKGIQEKIAAIGESKDFTDRIAGAVGKHLPRIDEEVSRTLEAQGKSLSDVDPATLDRLKNAARRALETQANTTFYDTLNQQVSFDPAIRPDVVTRIAEHAFEPDARMAEAISQELAKPSIATESIPPNTIIHHHEVSGSVADHSLTYDGKPWVLMDNGVKNIGNLFKTVGETGDIDKQALASNLQNATKLWTDGQLNYTDHPDLYRIFHLSNGTASVYNNLLDDNTLESLKKLGIVKK